MNPPETSKPAEPVKPTLEYFNASIASLQKQLAETQAEEVRQQQIKHQLQGGLQLQIGQRNLFYPEPLKSAPSKFEQPLGQ